MSNIRIGSEVVNFDPCKSFYVPDRREQELHKEAKFKAIDAEKENIEKTKNRYGKRVNTET